MGELEDAVMTRVWKWNRPVTVREVLEDLQRERSIAYTTVMTVLDNLHQKGWVRREAEGRAYRYEAVSTRAAYAAALMNDAWSQSDNAAAALVAFFGMMSEEQRQALRDAVRIVEGTTEVRSEGAAERRAQGGPEGRSEGSADGVAEGRGEESASEPAEERGEEAPEVVGEVPEVPDSAEAAAPAETADAPETGDQNPGSAQGDRGR
ncbi:BlaI/MecI/CopY family transcriptional regulator [Streptomyces carpinensis]|uniref:BlaI/MecI/CopY family transcriptional regulator n=2 Tax=Streptomyces carpinensis TaxID=66369 RepID=A0ABV1VZR8_9ACTN|nr:BlaI/MecI/CopY family transcriptional regulator [Streptomyces carpinensis]